MSAVRDIWRKEIIRGAALFCAVLAIGFVVHAAHRMVHEKVMSLPVALRDLRSEFARDDGGPGRSTAATWTYRSKLGAKQWVWIRNTRGSVTVEPAKGDSLQVSAVKTYRSSDSSSVRLVAVPFALRTGELRLGVAHRRQVEARRLGRLEHQPRVLERQPERE